MKTSKNNTLKQHPILGTKKHYFTGKTHLVSVDFSSSEISTDGSLILLEKIEREHKLIKKFGKYLPDLCDPRFVTYSREAQLKQRVFMMMLGYEDSNDVKHLQHDPLFKDVLQGDLASQPTISRFENSLDKHSIFELSNTWVHHYVSSLSGRKRIDIDVDATDDPTHGKQQMSMFNGYYGQFMLNELFFHDGETGQASYALFKKESKASRKSGKTSLSEPRKETPAFYKIHISSQKLAQRATVLFKGRKHRVMNEY